MSANNNGSHGVVAISGSAREQREQLRRLVRQAACGSCLWFHCARRETAARGECRFAPPGRKGFPRVGRTDWCRSFFSADEEDSHGR